MRTPIQELIEQLKEERDLHGYERGLHYETAIELAEAMLEKEKEVMCVSKRFSSAEKMAEWLHNNYEEIALNNGWKTQEDCQVPFCDLPKENKQTMIELCERFLNFC